MEKEYVKNGTMEEETQGDLGKNVVNEGIKGRDAGEGGKREREKWDGADTGRPGEERAGKMGKPRHDMPTKKAHSKPLPG